MGCPSDLILTALVESFLHVQLQYFNTRFSSHGLGNLLALLIARGN